MRYSKAKERIAIMKTLTENNVGEVLENSRGAVADTDKTGRMRVRYDLRTWIRRRMEEEGVTIYGMAKALGISSTNLNCFLTGRIPCPLDRVEELIWFFLPEGHMTDKEEE